MVARFRATSATLIQLIQVLLASLLAGSTSFRAFPAVGCFVAFALFGASLTEVQAKLYGLLRRFAPPGHKVERYRASIGAVAIQPDAGHHFLNVVFG